ncbi:hypothetical protein HDU83_003515 [Entophlyctis luteolus]|nr:hypothetical protein HDU83_003515 [Entophlyctis luteolus]
MISSCNHTQHSEPDVVAVPASPKSTKAESKPQLPVVDNAWGQPERFPMNAPLKNANNAGNSPTYEEFRKKHNPGSMTGNNYAYFFYATSDRTGCNALISAICLVELGKSPNIDLVTLVTPKVSQRARDRLEKNNVRVIVVESWQTDKGGMNSYWGDSLAKLRVFEQYPGFTYDLVVYFDTDVWVQKNLDHLFHLPPETQYWCPRSYWLPGDEITDTSSTLMVVKQSNASFKYMVELEKSWNHPTKVLYDMACHYVIMNWNLKYTDIWLIGEPYFKDHQEMADRTNVVSTANMVSFVGQFIGHFSTDNKKDNNYIKPWDIDRNVDIDDRSFAPAAFFEAFEDWNWPQSTTLLLHLISNLMKNHSYLATNIDMFFKKERIQKIDKQLPNTRGESAILLQKDLEALNLELTASRSRIQFPGNITTYNWLDFMMIPTLVYELEYPRHGKHFYEDWWNCLSWEDYARKWNRPVHEFLLRHVYLDSMDNLGLSKAKAMALTIIVSSFFHELVIFMVTKRFRGWFFVLQTSQIPLFYLYRTPFLKKRPGFRHWYFCLSIIYGLPLVATLYSRDYYMHGVTFGRT